MDQIAIVILNHVAYRETEQCVDSIIEKKLDIAGIVVVDNASDNESFMYLKRKYQDNDKIKIVRTRENLGFAKGNNIGIRVARAAWKTKFILLLNSDTQILEGDYLVKILNEYENGIGLMMTNVLRLNGRLTQKSSEPYDLLGVCLKIVKEKFDYFNIYFPKMIKRAVKDTVGPWISGCDILLTPDYFKVFHGLYPLTFLYGEEYILSIMLKKAKLESRIVENAYILHAESKSTPINLIEGTKTKRRELLKSRKHILFVRLMPLSILRWIVNYEK